MSVQKSFLIFDPTRTKYQEQSSSFVIKYDIEHRDSKEPPCITVCPWRTFKTPGTTNQTRTSLITLTISLGFCHSSVESSCTYHPAAPVWVQSTPSTLLSFIVEFVLYLSCEKNKNKQKEAGFGPFLTLTISSKVYLGREAQILARFIHMSPFDGQSIWYEMARQQNWLIRDQ